MAYLQVWSGFASMVLLAVTAPGLAQGGPPAGGPQGRPRGPRPAPTNLKVLPKTLTGDQVIQIMRGYESALGVECGFCHAQDPATHRLDFASDANPMKDNARVMIAMTDAINGRFLTQLKDRSSPETATGCGTCHRGESRPPAFVPKPEQRPEGARPPAGAMPGPG